MNQSVRRAIVVTLVGVAAALVVLATLLLWFGMAARIYGAQTGMIQFVIAGITIAAAFGIWHIFALVDRHFRELDRARGTVVTLAGNQSAVVPLREPGETGQEIERLYVALGDLTARYAEERAAPDRRLGAILASVSEALVVITEQGQVSLVNYRAKAMLDGERVRVGTSVFAALERGPVVDAVARACREGQAVEAMLRSVDGEELPARVMNLDEHGGAVLSFAECDVEHRAEVEHDLELHDRPPEIMPASDETPLTELHVTVMDTETTGLNPASDRIISMGAVRVCGGRIYRSLGFDRLVQPGVPIPARSTAVHGITDAMVADAEIFPAVHADFVELAQDTVWIGHNVAFDIAMLRRECALAGLPWREPKALDTLLLAASLNLGLPGLSLEILAGYFGIDVHGRHTALGDSLVTAEVYVRMLPLLMDAGVATYGEAVQFSQRAKQVIARQKAAGW